MVAITAEWLIAYALHSTVLLGTVYVLERVRLFVEIDVRETAWRTAMLGALLTATLHTALASQANGHEPLLQEAKVPLPIVVAAKEPAKVRTANSLDMRQPDRVSFPDGIRAEASSVRQQSTFITPAALTVPFDLRRDVIAILWVLVAAGGIALLGWQFFQVRRRCKASALCVDKGVRAEVATLTERARVRVTEIRQVEGATSPMVVPPSLLCIPHWAMTELDEPRRRAMIAHEIAHLMRRDQWWRLIYQAFVRLMFFQPFNRLAARRLDEIAEMACDEWAARAVDRRALAECLLACGERIVARSPRFASAIVGSESKLVERIRALLQRPQRLSSRVFAARGVLALAIVGVTMLPVVVFEAPARADTEWSVDDMRGMGLRRNKEFNFSRLRFEQVTTMKVRTQGRILGARFDGDVKFSDAEDGVIELDGTAVIEEVIVERSRARGERRIEVENTDEGIAHRYTVNGRDQPFEPEGRRFMGSAVPTLLRETAYDANSRVAQIIEKGGSDALLDEAALIESDAARGAYVAKLAAREQLDGVRLARALTLVAPIRSDFVRRKTLIALIEHQEFANDHQSQVLAIVTDMRSDFEQRQILTRLAPMLDVEDPRLATVWYEALVTVHSDFEARLAIVAMASREELPTAMVEATIRATNGIDSDFEARMALTAIAQHVTRTPTLASLYADATQHIGSDFEHRQALMLLIDSTELDAASFKAVLAASENIDSEHECNRVLTALMSDLPADADAIESYRQAHDRCSGTRT